MNINPKMIESAWQGFRTKVLSNASAEQLFDMRIAFFSGAISCHAIQMHIASPQCSSERALSILSSLYAELQNFDPDAPPEGAASNAH